jgi:hypothetical protein
VKKTEQTEAAYSAFFTAYYYGDRIEEMDEARNMQQKMRYAYKILVGKP